MKNVLEMLENSAEKYPDKIAFSDVNNEISYKELLRRARSIGSILLDGDNPVISQDAVVFYMEKSVDAFTAMMGAVYANAFYSFIDIRQPEERALSILNVLNPKVIITDAINVDNLKSFYKEEDFGARFYLIDELIKKADETVLNEKLLIRARDEFSDLNPLYVNFTSGSTGTPKGVAVGHRSVIDFIDEFTKVFNLTDADVFANQAPFDFDVSVKDIYSSLYVGARVALIPRDYFSNPAVLMDYLYDNKVTTLVWAVSAMCFVSIMNGLSYKTPVTVNKVMFSGEVMPVKQLNKWREALPDAMYVNLYGPTEITCNCTYHILDREYAKDEVIPIGIPFKNEKVFLLDDENKVVTEPDTEGEICVSGTCLAIGYFKDPEKTAAAFTQNPANDRFFERIYRTGDIGKYNADGNLVYSTRKDFQIKHMGQRIELGDIEVSAMSVDGVSRACCIYDFKRKKIVLFYVGEIEKEELTEKLHTKLPPFMMPNKTEQLKEFVLNKNGKIDRKVLQELI